MTTLTMHEVKKNQNKNLRKNHNDTTKNYPEKKYDNKVGLYVESNTAASTDNAPPTDNDDDNSNSKDK